MNDYLFQLITSDVAPLATAMVLGGLIGLERQLHNKPAGLRTNMMICMAAAVFTLLCRSLGGADADSRVIQGVITGVGFLGAGALMHTQGNVHGLTTAATIWLVTAVGIACGLGRYETAAVTTIWTLVVLWGLSPLDRKLKQNGRRKHPLRRSTDPKPAETD
jgi:putative Mg2+ transporter-C (MgtC) family protein